MSKTRRNAAIIVVIALVAAFFFVRTLTSGDDAKKLSLDGYTARLESGDVKTATIHDKDHTVTGELRNGTEYEVGFPDRYTGTITQDIVDAGVEDVHTDHQDESPWVSLLLGLLPFVLLALVLLWVVSQVQGGGSRVMGFGKSRAKLVTKDQPKVTFADVAGLDEAVEELEEIKEFLASPTKFQEMGAKIPKGVLLFGPPGTGKTLLAKAVAGEAGVPFFSISGSDFVEMFVGVGASRVRDLFEQAKAAAPAIVFVDEIDAVGRHRGAGLGGGHDEREQTLNQLLVEMDGFDQKQGVILLASTNRPDILDPALLRPGRFDRQIVVDRPDLDGRKAILRGARPRQAARARRRPRRDRTTHARLHRCRPRQPRERGRAAVGAPRPHAHRPAAARGGDRPCDGGTRASQPPDLRPREARASRSTRAATRSSRTRCRTPTRSTRSRSSRAAARSATRSRCRPRTSSWSRRSELVDELAMLLGGRTAEELIFADPTTGAQNDIDRATTIARQMVTEFGMSDALGPMRFGHPQGEVFLGRDFTSTPDYSDEVAASIDTEVRGLIEAAHAVALEVLVQNRAVLDRLAAELIEHETLETERVQELFADVRMWQRDAMEASPKPQRRPDPAPPAPGRASAAAASQADPHRGGSQ